jgi:hypothetical protein
MMAEGAAACYQGVVGYSNLMWSAAQKATDNTAKEILMVSSPACMGLVSFCEGIDITAINDIYITGG